MTQDASIRMRQLKQEESYCAKNMLEDWTSGQKIDRHIDRRLRAVDLGIGPRRAGIVPRISELRSQLADWAIGCTRGRCAEESDEASRDQ